MPGELKDRIAELAADLPRGWQARLAEHCGVKQPSVSSWVSGDTKTLDGLNLQLAAEFFGVTPKWLGSGKGPKHPTTSNVAVMEPAPAFRPKSSNVKPSAVDYRTVVHTLCDALEATGKQVSIRTFVEMADASYRKISR